ncbi:MAG: BON domain-containing protein [Proteobacteria bacterium]|nr:BON domain-containing protein [Pseudomonadota bacterium]
MSNGRFLPRGVRLGARWFAAALAVLPLAACAPAGIVAGAGATATTAALQERGLKGAANDARIYAEVSDLLFKDSLDLYRQVGLEVSERRVLLTGSVPRVEGRIHAVELAWRVEGVKEVINEIRVADEGGLIDRATDLWISTRLSAELLLDKTVASINYNVETVNGVVYLIGVAQNQTELDRVIDHARNLRNVRQVVSYVRLKGEGARRP